MAKSIGEFDPFRSYRFCHRIGFEGRVFGASKIEFHPGRPWNSKGQISVTSLLGPEALEFIRTKGPVDLVVQLYAVGDELERPSGRVVMTNVDPAQSRVRITDLDATSNDLVSVTATMDYDRLTIILGDSPLDKVAAVV